MQQKWMSIHHLGQNNVCQECSSVSEGEKNAKRYAEHSGTAEQDCSDAVLFVENSKKNYENSQSYLLSASCRWKASSQNALLLARTREHQTGVQSWDRVGQLPCTQ